MGRGEELAFLERAVASGAGGLWIWTGALRVSAALHELTAERLTGLDAASHIALEVIAFAEPVAGRVAEDLGIVPRLAALERAGLVQRDADAIVWAHFLARNDLMRGRLADADRRASESVALLRLHDPGLVLPWALAVLAQAAAQRGDVERAREAVRELDRQPCHMASCDADLEIACAWVEAMSGDLASARRRADGVARALCDAGLRGFGALAIHELARLGDPAAAAALLPEVEGRVAGPLARARTRAAMRRPAHAGARSAVDRRDVVAESARAAHRAARRAIAEDLGLSARTVGNHLNHIYAKLEVADRASLAALLGVASDPRRGGSSGRAN